MIISNDTERPCKQPLTEENVCIIIMIFEKWQKGGTDHYYSPSGTTLAPATPQNSGALPHIGLKGTMTMQALNSQMSNFTETQIVLPFSILYFSKTRHKQALSKAFIKQGCKRRKPNCDKRTIQSMLIVRAVHSTNPRDVRSCSRCTEVYHFYSVLEVIRAGF